MKALSDSELLGGDDDDNVSQEAVDSLGELGVKKDGLDENAVDPAFELVVADEDANDNLQDLDNAEQDAEADRVVAADAEGDDDKVKVDDSQRGADFLTPWERKNYSEAMGKRIARERRLKDEAEGRANVEAEGRRTAERELLESKKFQVDLLLDSSANKIASKTAEVKKAKEDGDTDAEMKAQGELDDLRANKRDLESAKTRLASVPATSDANRTAPTTVNWLGKNKWFTNAEFAEQAEYARAIDRTLVQEIAQGKSAIVIKSQDYYDELDRRIHKKMPTLRGEIRKTFGSNGTETAQRQQTRTTTRVAPVTRTARGAHVNGNRVTLKAEDLDNMRKFGMNTDPKSAEGQRHLKEYALNLRSGE